jgi:hypothetical protein
MKGWGGNNQEIVNYGGATLTSTFESGKFICLVGNGSLENDLSADRLWDPRFNADTKSQRIANVSGSRSNFVPGVVLTDAASVENTVVRPEDAVIFTQATSTTYVHGVLATSVPAGGVLGLLALGGMVRVVANGAISSGSSVYCDNNGYASATGTIPVGRAINNTYENGNLLTVQLAQFPPSLPTVTTSDNGKILSVVSGVWASATAPSSLPTVTTADNNKVLTVTSGAWAAGAVPTSNVLASNGTPTITGPFAFSITAIATNAGGYMSSTNVGFSPAGTTLFTVTYSSGAYSSTPRSILLTALDLGAAIFQPYVTSSSASGFTVKNAVTQNISGQSSFAYSFLVMQ